jgi:cytosolic 5'-nucleotidase 3
MEREKLELNSLPENVVIANLEEFSRLLQVFKEQGQDKIHVLADFDRTLTKVLVNGKKIQSIQAILRDGSYLTPDYAAKAHALFEKYHPIEIDPGIPYAEKKEKMKEWWQAHNQLMIESGLNKNDILRVARDPIIQMRSGAKEFLQTLAQQNIPVVIMSSAGLGILSISSILERDMCFFDNIQIISNEFEFDNNGLAIKVKEPIIHVLNKDETVIKDFPDIFERVKAKKNVILLGDNIEDIDMVIGFEYDNLLKIGFLNENIKENLDKYKENFDLIILNDGDMEFVNKLMKELL